MLTLAEIPGFAGLPVHFLKGGLPVLDPRGARNQLGGLRIGIADNMTGPIRQMETLADSLAGAWDSFASSLINNFGDIRGALAGLGWQNVTGERIRYRRGKTKVEADLPILPELAAELRHVPTDRLIFLATAAGTAHTAAGFGNWFADRCAEAGLDHCSAHGLRKAGATRLAKVGASEHEIMAFLAHASPREGATYTRKAQRSRLADAAFARLSGPKGEQNLSNLPERLDKGTPQATERKDKNV